MAAGLHRGGCSGVAFLIPNGWVGLLGVVSVVVVMVKPVLEGGENASGSTSEHWDLNVRFGDGPVTKSLSASAKVAGGFANQCLGVAHMSYRTVGGGVNFSRSPCATTAPQGAP